jgi:hypothetical protein
MHAKMTRDRKKCFISTIEKTIQDLEKNNKRMEEFLTKVDQNPLETLSSAATTPVSSPEVSSVVSRIDMSPLSIENEEPEDRSAMPIRHGFTLIT